MSKHLHLPGAFSLLFAALFGGAGAARAPVEKPKPPLVLRGHRYPVLHLAFSPDGKKLVSGGLDRMVILWDAVKGEKITTLYTHATNVNAVAFSPDGKLIASAATFQGIDTTIRVWDLAAGKVHALFEGRFGGVGCMRFSPDGKTLATATFAQIRLWDLSTKKQRAMLDSKTEADLGHDSLVYTPAGKLLAVASERQELHFWDVEKRKKIVGEGESHAVMGRAFSPDGKILAKGCDDEVEFWDVTSGKKLPSLKLPPRITSLAFSHDGKTLAVGSREQDTNSAVIRLVDLATKKAFATWKGGQRGGIGCLFSPDGRTLAITPSHENTIILWQVPRRPQTGK